MANNKIEIPSPALGDPSVVDFRIPFLADFDLTCLKAKIQFYVNQLFSSDLRCTDILFFYLPMKM